MKTRILAALVALVCWPALAAVETTTVNGTVYDPSATGATGGKIVCTLSSPGSASNGSTLQRVAGKYQATIQSDGSVNFTLVPNNVITPAGTYYTCEITVNTTPRATWTETWNVATAPDPIAIGSISRTDIPNTLVAGNCINTDADSKCEVTSNATSTVTLDPDDDGTANYTFIASTPTANYCLAQNAGNTGLTYVACGAVAGSSGQMQYNASGTMGGAPGMVLTGSGLIATTKFKHLDEDTDGDGTIDAMIIGDYDADGTLECEDITKAANVLCSGDITGASAQYTKTNPTTSDTDGDGTANATITVCGDLTVLPGIYKCSADTTSSNRVTIKWDNIRIHGNGAKIVSTEPDSAMFSRAGTVTGTNYPTLSVGHGTPIQNVLIEGFEIIGRGSRLQKCKDFSATTCQGDADNDGTNDNYQHCVEMVAPDNVIFQNNTIHDCDRQGIDIDPGLTQALKLRGVSLLNNDFRGDFGEHCVQVDSANMRIIGNKFAGCDGIIKTGADRGYMSQGQVNAVEMFCSTDAGHPYTGYDQGIVLADNTFDSGSNGLYWFGPACYGNIGEISVTGNTFRNMRGFGVGFDSSGSANSQEYRSLTVTGNTYSNNTTYPSNQASTYLRRAIFVQLAASSNVKQVAVTGNTVSMYRNASATQARDDQPISVYANNATIGNNVVYIEADKKNIFGDAAISAAGTNLSITGNTVTCDNSVQYSATFPSCEGVDVFSPSAAVSVTGNSFKFTTAPTDGAGNNTAVHLQFTNAATVSGNQVTHPSGAGGSTVYIDGANDVLVVGNAQSGGSALTRYNNSPLRVSEISNKLYNATGSYVSGCTSSASCVVQGNECIKCFDIAINHSARGWFFRTDYVAGGNPGDGTLDTTPILQVLNGTQLQLFKGTNPLVFEGTTDDGTNVTNLTVIDPTAPRTITLPDDSGTALISTLATNSTTAANSVWAESNALVFEGATADANETRIIVNDPTADRTIVIHNTADNGATTALGTTIPVTFLSSISPVTVSNTGTETSFINVTFGSPQIPANELSLGGTLRIHAEGYWQSNAADQTLRIRTYLGATAFCDSTAMTAANTAAVNKRWSSDCYIVTQAQPGATVATQGQGMVTRCTGANGTACENWYTVNTGTTNLATNGQLTADVKAQWGGAGATDTITCTTLTMEMMH